MIFFAFILRLQCTCHLNTTSCKIILCLMSFSGLHVNERVKDLCVM